jgi:allantoin racemase
MRKKDGEYVDVWSEPFRKILAKEKRADTQLDVADLGINKEINTPYFPGVPFAAADILKTIVKAEQTGYDAVIIGCTSDPCVQEGKRHVNIPVIGPTEAGISVAKLYNRKFGFITPGGVDRRRILAGYPTLESVGVDNMPIRGAQLESGRGSQELEELIKHASPEKVRDHIFSTFRKALVDVVPKLAKSCVEDGAEMILFGCTFWSGWTEELRAIQEAVKVPVLDSGITALKVGESLAAASQL